jgi:hypothetical protein
MVTFNLLKINIMRNKILFLIIFSVFLKFTSLAQGDLLITPNRVVFNTKKTKEIINLVNTGNKTETYTVSFVERRMNEDGSFTEISIPETGQNFAKPHLRIYPRSVTLLPGEGQVVMLQRRRNSKNKTGEYRSHLYFRSTTNYEALGEKITDSITGIGVNLIPIYGLTIPVIFHSGIVSATANLSDIKLENKKGINSLNFTLNRKGNKSLYGDFNIKYFPIKWKPTIIAQMNGVAIYTTIKRRFMSIQLPKNPLINYKEGEIRIIYQTRPKAPQQKIFANSILNLKA